MQIFAYTLIIVLGASVGSFINALVYRLSTHVKGIWTGRSFCPACKKQLETRDLIPVLSFIFLRGKCRFCHKAISFKYPVTELLTALSFLIIFLVLPWDDCRTYIYLAFTIILISIAVYDFLYFEIPDELSFPAMLFAGIVTLLPCTLTLQEAFVGGLIPLTFFGLQFWLSQGKFIGGGDLRLGALMGLMLGWKYVLVALLLSYFIGALISLPILLFKRKRGGTPIPFAPLLALGTFSTLLWGKEILNWYLNLIL